ncbi:recombinase family protein [Riemerella anatipestifer]|nr:recombinase family protein [Riemerella anatipestifer]
MTKFVSYYRVSTQKQGNSGLGLEAQKSTIQNYLKDIEAIAEFTDIESGTKKGNDRQGLKDAISYCKIHNAKLIIAKLDRLSRNVSFIAQLMESDIEFVICDQPQATRFTIHIFAALGEQEARFISERTKSALAEAKKRGKKLGSPQNLTDKSRVNSLEVRKQNAVNNENSRKAGALIVSLRQSGKSFYQITKEINALGFKTRTNKAFHQAQVKILYERYKLS